MRLPLWALRLMHRSRLSRSRLRGGWIHSRFGDRILDKALWRPTRESLARAWLVGFPITILLGLFILITSIRTQGPVWQSQMGEAFDLLTRMLGS